MSELCVNCKENEIEVGKWKLCKSCYFKLRRTGEINTLKTNKIKHKSHSTTLKISDECLNEMVKEGFTTTDIAKTCNVSRQAVHFRAGPNYKSYNEYHRHWEIIFLYKIGFLPKEIPNFIKVSYPTCNRILNKYKVKRPIKTAELVVKLFDGGMSKKEIIKKLKLDSTKVSKILNRNKRTEPRVRSKNKRLFEIPFLRRLGFSYNKISELVGVHVNHVYYILRSVKNN